MATRYASSRTQIAECDICGFRVKLKELRALTIKDKTVDIRVCAECWSPDHPQLHLGRYPVVDPQAVRNARPDFSGYAQSRAQLVPVTTIVSSGQVGQVTVSIS